MKIILYLYLKKCIFKRQENGFVITFRSGLCDFQYIKICAEKWKETRLKNKRKNIDSGMQATAMAAQPVIKVAGICGSLRKGSYNRGLLNAAMEICKDSIKGMEIEYVDISPLPFLNTDLEVNGTYPPAVEAFRKKIEEADCYLFASPEYNYSVTGPLKNAIDWASRPPNVWGDKAAAIVSAGGGFGGGRSQYHLRQIGVYLDIHFINKPEFFLNVFQQPPKFDSDSVLTDEETKQRLRAVLLALQAFALRLNGKCE